jgi:hypothetical protein
MKTLISGLTITRYQNLLKTELNETERQAIQTLLGEEEVWLKLNMPQAHSQSESREIARDIPPEAQGHSSTYTTKSISKAA